MKEIKGERTILTGKDYRDFRAEVYRKQHGRCLQCSRLTVLDLDILSDASFHIHHRGSRGMGGSFRDDVLGPKRGQVEGGLCGHCHREEHNQA